MNRIKQILMKQKRLIVRIKDFFEIIESARTSDVAHEAIDVNYNTLVRWQRLDEKCPDRETIDRIDLVEFNLIGRTIRAKKYLQSIFRSIKAIVSDLCSPSRIQIVASGKTHMFDRCPANALLHFILRFAKLAPC
ncbi:putative glucan phosphorylase [Trichinella spiralis]|uniref:putative glucan phosphorylase n=1 Tax=Trichinella spiralis TaxID=6334 RepID=UPI0001EFCE93|nr:putative glucan phosphorylase [Trichinella spiralis]